MKKYIIPILWMTGILILFIPMIITGSSQRTFSRAQSGIIIFSAFSFIIVGIFLNVLKKKNEFDKSQLITRFVLIALVFGYNVYNLITHLVWKGK